MPWTTTFAHAATEMNHRIANNLTLLAALIESGSREVVDPEAIIVLDATRRRIHAIGSVHRRLYKIESIDGLELVDFIEDLACDLRIVCEGAGRNRRILVEGASVLVSADQAVAIGILVAELVTNACKHAYPNFVAEDVRIRIDDEGEDGWTLSVEDDGRGYAPSPSTAGSGIGSRIIDASVARLGASCVWEDNRPGTRFVLRSRASCGPIASSPDHGSIQSL